MLAELLAAPFRPDEVHARPGATSGSRALVLWFIDARAVMSRLDNVFGIAGWQDSYQLLPDGSAVCTLQVRIDGEWISKQDVGSPSEQPDAGDRVKSAFSDALKRAAVKLGIARYLYQLPPLWVDYDPVKKRFTRTPQLPEAVTRKSVTPAVAVANGLRGSQLVPAA